MAKDVVILNFVFGAEWHWGNPQTGTEYDIFLLGLKFGFYLWIWLINTIGNSESVTIERRMGNELEAMWKEVVMAWLGVPEVPRRNMKNFNQGNWYSSWNLNQASPKYKSLLKLINPIQHYFLCGWYCFVAIDIQYYMH
jgi:hypothetical protein